jgi:hypothetical protein
LINGIIPKRPKNPTSAGTPLALLDIIYTFSIHDKISKSTGVVYHNPLTNETVVSHRGTQGVIDWANNLAYAVGAYELTPRYREGKKIQDEAEKKYGKTRKETNGRKRK